MAAAKPDVPIRPAIVDDCPAINAIYNHYVHTSPATFDTEPMTEAWRRGWFDDRVARGLPMLVAVVDRAVAGWCCLSLWSPKGAYETTRDESIYVADGFRGMGVGRALLGAILDEAKRAEVHVVMAGVVACQDASLALHRALGFEQAAYYHHMGYKLGAWHDLIVMQRHLWE